MATILPKKTGIEKPMALDDDHHELLAADPSISQFPQGSTFGDNNGYNTLSSGSSPFGSTGGFGSPTSTGFGGGSGFGAPASGFGSTQNINQSNSNQQMPPVEQMY